jgi:hypothetical protein
LEVPTWGDSRRAEVLRFRVVLSQKESGFAAVSLLEKSSFDKVEVMLKGISLLIFEKFRRLEFRKKELLVKNSFKSTPVNRSSMFIIQSSILMAAVKMINFTVYGRGTIIYRSGSG